MNQNGSLVILLRPRKCNFAKTGAGRLSMKPCDAVWIWQVYEVGIEWSVHRRRTTVDMCGFVRVRACIFLYVCACKLFKYIHLHGYVFDRIMSSKIKQNWYIYMYTVFIFTVLGSGDRTGGDR